MRPLLCGIGALCLVAGLLPGRWGGNGWTGTVIGLPFSPLFRSHRETIEQPPSFTVDEDGRRVQSWYLSSTVYSWEIRALSWSAALVCLGLVLLAAPLRAAWKEGAKQPRVDDGGP